MRLFEKVATVALLSSFLLWVLELLYALFSGAWLVRTVRGCVLFLLISLLLFAGWGALAAIVQGIYLSVMRFVQSRAEKLWSVTRVKVAVSIIVAGTLLPYILYFSQRLFSGEGISRFAYVSYIKAGFCVIGVFVVYILSFLVVNSARMWFSPANRFKRKLATLCSLAILILFYAINAEWYVGQYAFVHQALSLYLFVIAEFIVLNLLGKRGLSRLLHTVAWRVSLFVVFLLVAGIVILGFATGGITPGSQQLSYIYSQEHMGKQLVWIYHLRDKVGSADARSYEEYLIKRDTFTRGTPPLKHKGYNFIWIMVDALRADHLPMYGYARNTSPRLRDLAGESILFLNNYTQGPNTGTSLSAQMTGCYTSTIAAGGGINKFDTLAEMLLRSGYQTWAIAQQWDINTLEKKGKEGVAFEKIEVAEMISAPEIEKKAMTLLENRDKNAPFFLFMFFYEVHDPYEKHAEFDYGNRAEDMYDSEISYVDKYLGDLWTYLKQKGFDRDTILLVTADHGDEIGQHGGWGHHWKLYDCLIHVPFILYIPGVEPMVISTPIQSMDLCPSMVELLDLKTATRFDGSSFLPYIARSKPPYNPEIYSEAEFRSSNKVCLIYYPWKLLYHISDSYFELFNLEDDPAEKVNRINDDREVAVLLKKKLLSWLNHRKQRHSIEAEVENAAIRDVVNRLRVHDVTVLKDLDALEETRIKRRDFDVLLGAIEPYFSRYKARFLIAQTMKNQDVRESALGSLYSMVKRADAILGGADDVVGETLGSSEYGEAEAIIKDLSNEEHVDYFMSLVTQDKGISSENCLDIIALLRPQSCRDKLFTMYNEESDPGRRSKIFHALCRLGDPRVEDELFEKVEGLDDYRKLEAMIPLFASYKSQRCRDVLLKMLRKSVWYHCPVVTEIGKVRNDFMLPVLKAVFSDKGSPKEVSHSVISFSKKMAILHFVNIKGRGNLSADDRSAIKEAYENDIHLAQYEEIRKLYESL